MFSLLLKELNFIFYLHRHANLSNDSIYSRKEVIQKSVGIDPEHVGAPLWKLALCLLMSWVVVVCCLIKGVKSSGKVSITRFDNLYSVACFSS